MTAKKKGKAPQGFKAPRPKARVPVEDEEEDEFAEEVEQGGHNSNIPLRRRSEESTREDTFERGHYPDPTSNTNITHLYSKAKATAKSIGIIKKSEKDVKL